MALGVPTSGACHSARYADSISSRSLAAAGLKAHSLWALQDPLLRIDENLKADPAETGAPVSQPHLLQTKDVGAPEVFPKKWRFDPQELSVPKASDQVLAKTHSTEQATCQTCGLPLSLTNSLASRCWSFLVRREGVETDAVLYAFVLNRGPPDSHGPAEGSSGGAHDSKDRSRDSVWLHLL